MDSFQLTWFSLTMKCSTVTGLSTRIHIHKIILIIWKCIVFILPYFTKVLSKNTFIISAILFTFGAHCTSHGFWFSIYASCYGDFFIPFHISQVLNRRYYVDCERPWIFVGDTEIVITCGVVYPFSILWPRKTDPVWLAHPNRIREEQWFEFDAEWPIRKISKYEKNWSLIENQ